jgi:TPR repeat protein
MRGEKLYIKACLISDQLYAKDLVDEKKKDLYSVYLKLLRKAAYSGNHKAQFELGMTYEDINYWGSNPSCNPEKCIYWYKKACEGNIDDACNSLAIFYEQGNGCKQDFELAASAYKKAIKLGNKLAKKNYQILKKQLKSVHYNEQK